MKYGNIEHEHHFMFECNLFQAERTKFIEMLNVPNILTVGESRTWGNNIW